MNTSRAERVRQLIGISQADASDEFIMSYDITGIAEVKINGLIEKSGIDVDYEMREACYVYQTALNLVHLIPDFKSKQTTHAKVEMFSSKTDTLIEAISERLCQLLNMLGVTSCDSSTSMFEISNSDERYVGEAFHI